MLSGGDVIFGYWRKAEAENSTLPWPVSSVTPDPALLGQISQVEDALSRGLLDGGLRSYKGFSRSRLTGEVLGSGEFFVRFDGTLYAWPEDFGSHYLAAGVAVPPAFRALITDLVRRIPQSQEIADASR